MMKTFRYPGIVFLLFQFHSLAAQDEFSMRVVASDLNSAWEITYGPDDSLWVTENKVYLVSRIDPINGGKEVLLDLSKKKNFAINASRWPQGGLMGLVLHPSMYTEWPNPSKPYVYLAYVYKYNATNGCANADGSGCYFHTKIVRYEFVRTTVKKNGETIPKDTLENEVVIDSTLHGSTDHNGGRLAIGKVNGTDYLFYSIGEMGTGQFYNANRPNSAQNLDSTMGKILRYNLEPDTDPDQADSWIPDDNPFTYPSSGKRSPVWTLGHRNPQGIVFGSDGTLYSSEQQDMTDDEINIIEKGRNYGWPKVSGYCDGDYDNYKLAGQPIVSEEQFCEDSDVKEPIYTLFPDHDPQPLESQSYLNWPTVATSGIDIYEKNFIPGWSKSLLVPTLKGGVVYRLKLSADGKTVDDISIVPDIAYQGRFRDLAISPDGSKIYVACDNSGAAKTSESTYGGNTPLHPGRILEFTYTGSALAIRNDSLYTYTRNTRFQVYPNPATTTVHVNSKSTATKPVVYYLFNSATRLARYGKSFTDAFDIDVSALPRGWYILKIYDGHNRSVYTGKVTVQ